jgi:hypothetical protein
VLSCFIGICMKRPAWPNNALAFHLFFVYFFFIFIFYFFPIASSRPARFSNRLIQLSIYYTAQHHQSAVSTKKAKNKRDVVALLVCRMYIRFDRETRDAWLGNSQYTCIYKQ